MDDVTVLAKGVLLSFGTILYCKFGHFKFRPLIFLNTFYTKLKSFEMFASNAILKRRVSPAFLKTICFTEGFYLGNTEQSASGMLEFHTSCN